MELYFTCPVTGKVFGSDSYVLSKKHEIVESENRRRELVGMVDMKDPCPLCGGFHRFEVKDVICPLTRGSDDR